MLYKFFTRTATSLAGGALLAMAACLPSQAQTPADAVVMDMNAAYKRGDKARLAQLLPQASGHALEPWAAYWELKARLPEASPDEVQDFYARYPGSYQEDRLRNDWLLLLGSRSDWPAFAQQYPLFRMNDDREVRCYAVLAEQLRSPTRYPPVAIEV